MKCICYYIVYIPIVKKITPTVAYNFGKVSLLARQNSHTWFRLLSLNGDKELENLWLKFLYSYHYLDYTYLLFLHQGIV